MAADMRDEERRLLVSERAMPIKIPRGAAAEKTPSIATVMVRLKLFVTKDKESVKASAHLCREIAKMIFKALKKFFCRPQAIPWTNEWKHRANKKRNGRIF